MIRAIFIFPAILLCGVAFAQERDECRVYSIDLKASLVAYEEYIKTRDAQKLKDTRQILGIFSPEIGEEHTTTKHFIFLNSKKIVTASIMYTDESMILQKKGAENLTYDSIKLAIAISGKKFFSAFDASDNAVAETTYTEDTLGAEVYKRIIINGRPYDVGLTCRCNGSTSPIDNTVAK